MKICLALNDKNFEEYIKKKLQEKDSNITFTTPALYADMVVTICKQDLPDILLLNEALPASTNKNTGSKEHHMSFGEMIGWVRKNTNTRIIFICSTRPVGDKFLKSIVSLGIYDIISGDTVKVSEIINCIFNPKNLADIDYLIEVEEMTDAIPETKKVAPVKVTDEVKADNNANFKESKKADKKKAGKTGNNQKIKQSDNSMISPVTVNGSDNYVYSQGNTQGNNQGNNIDNQVINQGIQHDTSLEINNGNNLGVQIPVPAVESIQEDDFVEPDSMILTSDMMPEHFKQHNNDESFIFDIATDYDLKPFVNMFASGTNNLTLFNNNQNYNNYYNYGNNMGGYNEQTSKCGKIFTFLNIKEGDGVTSITTNTAFAGAFTYPDKKFLLIDAMPGKTTLFDRLYLPKGGVRLDTMESVGNAGINKIQILNSNANDAKRFKDYPDNLVFLRTSGDFAQNGNMDKVKRNLALLKTTYDYIFINCTGKYYTDFLKALVDISDNICYVTTQDFENLTAISKDFDNIKSRIIINRYVKGCNLDESYISKTFALSNDNIRTLTFDGNFVKYQTKGLPYYPYTKLKTRQQLISILTMLI